MAPKLTGTHSGCSYQANFAIGGVFPDGSPKTGDNAELGVYRNNCEFSKSNPNPAPEMLVFKECSLTQ